MCSTQDDAFRTGVILAGGRSTRFGEEDKATAELGGMPLLRMVANRLVEVLDEVVVNCRPEQRPALAEVMDGYPLSVQFALDEIPDRGPVAGIRNGLREATGAYALVVACDMPFVDPEFVSFLFERAASSDGAVVRLESGWLQTTQAVYHVDSMLRACNTALQTDNPRILDPLEELDVRIIEESELSAVTSLDTFENVNTKAELQQAERQLSGSDADR